MHGGHRPLVSHPDAIVGASRSRVKARLLDHHIAAVVESHPVVAEDREIGQNHLVLAAGVLAVGLQSLGQEDPTDWHR